MFLFLFFVALIVLLLCVHLNNFKVDLFTIVVSVIIAVIPIVNVLAIFVGLLELTSMAYARRKCW